MHQETISEIDIPISQKYMLTIGEANEILESTLEYQGKWYNAKNYKTVPQIRL